MYTDFYRLKEKPFNLTPSTRFLYLGENHKEALALLTYGVKERMGFILLTGEVGTGKTTMVRALLKSLDQGVQCVYLSNPVMSTRDFFNYLAVSAFHKKVNFSSKTEFLLEFESFLKKCLQQNKIFILIIDEAQKLSFDLLEEIRLLSNMESPEDKLVNIFLVGQPELNENLSRPECRPLLQRISIRYHIHPLDYEGTGKYLAARLKTAGAEKVDSIFSQGAVKAIYRYSQGYPRMINVLADNALLLGYSRNKKTISSVIIEECFGDLALEGTSWNNQKTQPDPAKADEVRPGAAQAGDGRDNRSGKIWKLAALLVVVLALFLVQNWKGIYAGLHAVVPRIHWNGFRDRPQQQEQPSVKRPAQESTVQDPQDTEIPLPVPEKEIEQGQAAMLDPVESRETEEPASEETVMPPTTIVVKEGDTFAELVARVYGRLDEETLQAAKDYNPELTNINFIKVGQKLLFPQVLAPEGPIYTVHVASYRPFHSAREFFDRLINKGHEAYLIPVIDPQKGKLFRVTLGSFKSLNEANAYAERVLDEGISDYAKTIQLDMK